MAYGECASFECAECGLRGCTSCQDSGSTTRCDACGKEVCLGCEDRAFEGDLWWRECDVCGTKVCGECAGGKEWGCELCDRSTCTRCAPPAACSVCHAEG